MVQTHLWVYNFTLDIPPGTSRRFRSGPSELYRNSVVQVAAVPNREPKRNAMSVPKVVRYAEMERIDVYIVTADYIRFEVVNESNDLLQYFNIVISVTI